MNTPETIYHQLLDSFTSSHVCFALYRLPWTDEPILVMQEEGEPEYIHSLNELNQKKGFLLSPFQFTPAHPAVLIRPDIQAHDWEDIKSALQRWMTRHPQQAAPSHSIDASTDSHISSEKEEKDLYTETFSRFILPLKEKQFRKLVLSRSTTHTLNDQFSPLSAFIQACNSYPRMMISLCHTPSTGTWIGSTPEIILSGHEKDLAHSSTGRNYAHARRSYRPPNGAKSNKERTAFVGDYTVKPSRNSAAKSRKRDHIQPVPASWFI